MSGGVGDRFGERVRVPDGDKGDDRGLLLPFQVQMIDHILKSASNEIMFLPTGLGQENVVNAVIRRMLSAEPGKHVVLCAARPGQVLSHAARLRRYFDSEETAVSVGAFCGGDFLYDFPKEFEENRILVFTAGLLMRLTKLGVYALDRCSLMVLHDAFYAIRNHPMNTLVREYYWKIEKGRPKVLGTMLPQTHALKRPFDKLRQSVRRLSHSAQAGICLPTGHALESLASRIHHSHIAIHAYNILHEEEEFITLVQKHFLHVWDVLHEHKQNHFGRLIHYPAVSGKDNGAENECDDAVVDPFHHDWEQILIMVKHSIAFASSLPDSGSEHCKNEVTLMILEHVLGCVESVLECMAHGSSPAVNVLHESLVNFRSNLELAAQKYGTASEAQGGSPEYLLLRDLRDVIGSSPLLQHIGQSSLEDINSNVLEEKFVTSEAPSRITMLKLLVEELGYSFYHLEESDEHSAACIVVSDEASARSMQENLRDVVSPENLVIWKGDDDDDVLSAGRVVLVTEQCAQTDRMLCIMKEKATNIIWFSPNSVMHASGFDYDSNALTVLRRICRVGTIGSPSAVSGPKCHILATKEQSLAWIDISKADQVLLAAAEFVSFGDASLEESLSQLALSGKSMFSNHGVSSALSVAIPSPSAILHLLCLGLCGYPPLFNLYPVVKESNQREDTWQATVVLPQDLIIELAAARPSARLRGSAIEPFVGQMAESSSEARDAAAEAALSYMTLSNTVSAYWQTRILLDLVSKSPNIRQEPRMSVAGGTNSSQVAATVPASPFSSMVTPSPKIVDNENLICSICGIVTTSVAHLNEHKKGRRHLKNLARLQEQQKANMPPVKAPVSPHEDESDSQPDIPNELDANHISVSNTIDKLPSSLSDAMARRNSQPLRQSSNVYESFPCVRVGEYALPSSMDLRAFLEEMENREDILSEPSPRITHKSPRDRKKSPKQTPRNSSQHSTPRQRSSNQQTPRDNGKSRISPRIEPAGPYPYPVPHEFIPNYGMVVNDPYYSDLGAYQYGPIPFIQYMPQQGMVPTQVLQPVTSGQMMPAYFPGMMVPNHDIMHAYDPSTKARQHRKSSPRYKNGKN